MPYSTRLLATYNPLVRYNHYILIITFIITAIPIITMPETEQSYTLTENGNITCTATGYPVPDIVWLDNDGSVVDTSRLITDSGMTTDIDNLSSVSVSMIVTRSDAGVYTCFANNSFGNDSSIINITVQCKLLLAICFNNACILAYLYSTSYCHHTCTFITLHGFPFVTMILPCS